MKFDFQANSRNSPDASTQEARERIRQSVQGLLGLGEEVTVMVTELTCQEEGCPPIETVIAILTTPGQPRQIKIHRPMVEVTQEELQEALTGSHRHSDTNDEHSLQGE